jgi:hypothetical protein
MFLHFYLGELHNAAVVQSQREAAHPSSQASSKEGYRVRRFMSITSSDEELTYLVVNHATHAKFGVLAPSRATTALLYLIASTQSEIAKSEYTRGT